jgi:hypothetical protein
MAQRSFMAETVPTLFRSNFIQAEVRHLQSPVHAHVTGHSGAPRATATYLSVILMAHNALG